MFVWFFVIVMVFDLKSEIFIFKSIRLKIKIILKEDIFLMENYFYKKYVKFLQVFEKMLYEFYLLVIVVYVVFVDFFLYRYFF